MYTSFKKKVWEYYKKNKRQMPWRFEKDPYKILVSEIMLQQTQVDRVREKYAEFLKKFPRVQALADAAVADVLAVWKGLGYNRRALHLKKAAEVLVQQYDGKFPRDVQALDELPGIGPATAAAIIAYAFNEPTVFIETNIRSVFLHHFFKDKTDVSDVQLLPHIHATLDTKNPREWYYALMDYGTMLKRTRQNPSRASTHYAKQSKFEGSNRQLRGKILAVYVAHRQKKQTAFTLDITVRALPDFDATKIKEIFQKMQAEGFFKAR